MVGPLPVGYLRRRDYDERSGKVLRTWIEPDPETAPLVQRIFVEYATGSYSLKTLALRLNAEGLRPRRSPQFENNRKKADLFTADVLKDILSNPRYAGRVPRRDGQEFQWNFKALIDSATSAACERVRLKHRSFRSAKSGKRPRVTCSRASCAAGGAGPPCQGIRGSMTVRIQNREIATPAISAGPRKPATCRTSSRTCWRPNSWRSCGSSPCPAAWRKPLMRQWRRH